MSQFQVTADPIADALAEYGGPITIVPPVIKYAAGAALMNIKGTLTEKRLNIVEHASTPARLYFATMSGKVGKSARESFGVDATVGMARAARAGNYRPIAEALAVITGKSVLISSRSTFEAQKDILAGQIADLKDSGYVVCKKTGTLVPGGRRKAIENAMVLIETVYAIVATL